MFGDIGIQIVHSSFHSVAHILQNHPVADIRGCVGPVGN